MAGELWQTIEAGAAPPSVAALVSRERSTIISWGHAPATLDAARWAVATTDTFADAILAAVNLGDDADTVGAVAGQYAGALYGVNAMPEAWLQKLAWRERIEDLGRQLWALRIAG